MGNSNCKSSLPASTISYDGNSNGDNTQNTGTMSSGSGSGGHESSFRRRLRIDDIVEKCVRAKSRTDYDRASCEDSCSYIVSSPADLNAHPYYGRGNNNKGGNDNASVFSGIGIRGNNPYGKRSPKGIGDDNASLASDSACDSLLLGEEKGYGTDCAAYGASIKGGILPPLLGELEEEEAEELIEEERDDDDEGLRRDNDELLCAHRDDISTDNEANLNNVPAPSSARKRIENLSRLLHKFQERLKNPGSAIKSNKKKKKAMQMYEEQMTNEREDDSKDRKGNFLTRVASPLILNRKHSQKNNNDSGPRKERKSPWKRLFQSGSRKGRPKQQTEVVTSEHNNERDDALIGSLTNIVVDTTPTPLRPEPSAESNVHIDNDDKSPYGSIQSCAIDIAMEGDEFDDDRRKDNLDDRHPRTSDESPNIFDQIRECEVSFRGETPSRTPGRTPASKGLLSYREDEDAEKEEEEALDRLLQPNAEASVVETPSEVVSASPLLEEEEEQPEFMLSPSPVHHNSKDNRRHSTRQLTSKEAVASNFGVQLRRVSMPVHTEKLTPASASPVTRIRQCLQSVSSVTAGDVDDLIDGAKSGSAHPLTKHAKHHKSCRMSPKYVFKATSKSNSKRNMSPMRRQTSARSSSSSKFLIRTISSIGRLGEEVRLRLSPRSQDDPERNLTDSVVKRRIDELNIKSTSKNTLSRPPLTAAAAVPPVSKRRDTTATNVLAPRRARLINPAFRRTTTNESSPAVGSGAMMRDRGGALHTVHNMEERSVWRNYSLDGAGGLWKRKKEGKEEMMVVEDVEAGEEEGENEEMQLHEDVDKEEVEVEQTSPQAEDNPVTAPEKETGSNKSTANITFSTNHDDEDHFEDEMPPLAAKSTSKSPMLMDQLSPLTATSFELRVERTKEPTAQIPLDQNLNDENVPPPTPLTNNVSVTSSGNQIPGIKKGPMAGLNLSPVLRTPMQARKWRTLAAAAAAKENKDPLDGVAKKKKNKKQRRKKLKKKKKTSLTNTNTKNRQLTDSPLMNTQTNTAVANEPCSI